nr:MAG TPA: hypothetical protein [Bacteriophage sp.]DAZ75733.1 MAG TPA: hypothetical protein [Caudoviricetes sp.]
MLVELSQLLVLLSRHCFRNCYLSDYIVRLYVN